MLTSSCLFCVRTTEDHSTDDTPNAESVFAVVGKLEAACYSFIKRVYIHIRGLNRHADDFYWN